MHVSSFAAGRGRSRFRMASWLLLVISSAMLASPYAKAQDAPGQNTSTPITQPTIVPEKCQPVTDVRICEDMPWNYTLFPNFRGHTSQTEANQELEQFRQLIEVNCSGAIVLFLCSIYAPFCTDEHPIRVLRPCKRLCLHVRDRCEPVFNQRAGGLPWPDHLNCDNYEDNDLCFGPQEQLNEVTIPPNLVSPGDTPSPPTDSSGSSMSTAATDQTMSTRCPIEMVVARKLRNKSFSFAGIDNCGPGCGGIYFSDSQRNIVAPLFILLFAFVCILFTAFTVATFFINRNRFHYPERPIVYLSLCYLILSGAYFIGAISKLVGGGDVSFGCTATYARSTEEVEHLITETQYSAEVIPALPSRFVFQSLPNDNVTLRTASCVILFLLAYYTQMAASLWWVILTFTWFLAAVLKWGEEAVARLWPLYHVVTWSLPAVQTILVLALQLVDGDQLSGLCYPGQFSRVALGVFVYMPLLIYLLLGTVFLVIGFSALVKIRHALERDPVKARKLGRLIIRIGVYAGLYILTNSILLFIHTYELAERESWEKSYVEGETCRSNSNPSQCENSPNFAAFLIRYIALFFVGICSTSWVFSKKTLSTWTKFFQSCGCGHAGKSDVSQAYGLPEKDPRRLQTAV